MTDVTVMQNDVYWILGPCIEVVNQWRQWNLGFGRCCKVPGSPVCLNSPKAQNLPNYDGILRNIDILNNTCYKGMQGALGPPPDPPYTWITQGWAGQIQVDVSMIGRVINNILMDSGNYALVVYEYFRDPTWVSRITRSNNLGANQARPGQRSCERSCGSLRWKPVAGSIERHLGVGWDELDPAASGRWTASAHVPRDGLRQPPWRDGDVRGHRQRLRAGRYLGVGWDELGAALPTDESFRS